MHVDQDQNPILISLIKDQISQSNTYFAKLVGKTGIITISHNLLKPDITDNDRGYHFMQQR